MKKMLLLFGFLFCVLSSQAEIVNFSDPNFKTAILNANVDTNNDGDIQLTEAAAIYSLNLFGNYSNTAGLEAFVNLNELMIWGDYLSVLNTNGLMSLQMLNCSASYALTSLNLSTNLNLQHLNCSGAAITNLDVSANTNLQTLDFSGCMEMTNINLSGLTNLTSFTCEGSYRLTSLTISGLTNLRNFNSVDCNALMSLDFSI